MKKILSICTILVLACMVLPAQNLVILHLNDTHSHNEPLRNGNQEGMGGYIEIASYVDSVRFAMGASNVLLLHAGDWSQGSSYFSEFGGEIEDACLKALAVDAVTLGNHEFDNGVEDLAKRLKGFKCPVLCANYQFPAALQKQVQDYTIIHRGGFKIGIFGLVCDLDSMIDGKISSQFTKLDDVEKANEIARYLKVDEKCDIVILLSHLGYGQDRDIVAKTSNIDLVIGGHSHTYLDGFQMVTNARGKEVRIIQDGCWGLYTGKINVY